MRINATADLARLGIRLMGLLLLVALVRLEWAIASDFKQVVEPILTRNCADCHSEKTKTSGFSVASQNSVIGGGNKHGRAVHPGDPARSPLVRFLKGEHQPAMPLGKTLARGDPEQIESWVRSLLPDESPKVSEWRWPFERPVQRDPPRAWRE